LFLGNGSINTPTTIEEMLKAVFSVGFVPRIITGTPGGLKGAERGQLSPRGEADKRQRSGELTKSGHDRFLSNTFKLIIHI
jgi:hypothetical protein